MTYTLTQAAEATGRSKSTILRAIQGRKISATKDELTQGWRIEPAELHRLYPRIADEEANDMARNGATLREVELLREMLTDKDRQIGDLSRRLEAVDEERRTTLRQLTNLLSDQRERPINTHSPAETTARKWWQRGRRESV